MKVLIVDDEPHLIHAIKALVPWQDMTLIRFSLPPQPRRPGNC